MLDLKELNFSSIHWYLYHRMYHLNHYCEHNYKSAYTLGFVLSDITFDIAEHIVAVVDIVADIGSTDSFLDNYKRVIDCNYRKKNCLHYLYYNLNNSFFCLNFF
jgi:hypothetical protein